ncbi:MAG: hypothetical protein KatS3mg022_3108 [Armatimonadota bacterium]|nr:MAG: hypothetical protein KatS3mg022_3108 [Armatimonadota bacterium]
MADVEGVLRRVFWWWVVCSAVRRLRANGDGYVTYCAPPL